MPVPIDVDAIVTLGRANEMERIWPNEKARAKARANMVARRERLDREDNQKRRR